MGPRERTQQELIGAPGFLNYFLLGLGTRTVRFNTMDILVGTKAEGHSSEQVVISSNGTKPQWLDLVINCYCNKTNGLYVVETHRQNQVGKLGRRPAMGRGIRGLGNRMVRFQEQFESGQRVIRG